MSSSGPYIGEADDIIAGRRMLLAVFSPESAPSTFCDPASAPQHTWEREISVCQPNISCCTTALLAEHLEASWSSWAAQTRVLTPVGYPATPHPCTDGYHCALSSSARNSSSCYGGGMISGSLLPSHSPLGFSCGSWLGEIPSDMGTLALAPSPVLLWVGKGH